MSLRLVPLSLLFTTAAFAQTSTGSITGLVADASGAAIAGARITVRNMATNATVNTASTATGNFTAPSLPPGDYEIAVTAPGFKRAAAAHVEVRATQITTQNITLEVGDVAESVTVSGEVPLINPNSASATTTVGDKILEDLPFMDRSTLSVVLL